MPITRVTQNVIFQTTTNILQQQTRRLLNAQEQVATQRRINTISDDPVGAGQVLDFSAQLEQVRQFMRNIDRATTLADGYDTSIQQANDLVTRARELVVAQANTATTSPQTREAVAIELIALREQLINIANTRIGNKHIYAGFADDTPPFSSASVAATPGGGNTGTGVVSTIGVTNVINLTGDDYRIDFTGPGTFDIVNVTQGVTISSGNAYTPGADIIFDGITLQITGAPNAGDSFDITHTPAGLYSGDNGRVEIEIEQDVRATINMTGDTVFLGVGISGGVDIFDIFNDTIDALRTNNETEIVAALTRFDEAQDQLVGQQAIIGARQNLFDNSRLRQEDVEINLQLLISSVEDIDVAEAATNFAEAQNAYQASLGAASRMIQPSLLDFLR